MARWAERMEVVGGNDPLRPALSKITKWFVVVLQYILMIY